MISESKKLDPELIQIIKDKTNYVDGRLAYIPSYILETTDALLNRSERVWKDFYLNKARQDISRIGHTGKNWKRYLLDWAMLNLKKTSGVYVVFSLFEKKPLYIGQSKDVKNRLNNEDSKRRFAFVKCHCVIATREEKEEFDRFTLEAKLIKRLNPSLNKIKTECKNVSI